MICVWIINCKCFYVNRKKVEENKHFHHLSLFYFQKGKEILYKQQQKISAVYRDGAITEGTLRKWFARFNSENFDLENREKPDRPDDDQIDD